MHLAARWRPMLVAMLVAMTLTGAGATLAAALGAPSVARQATPAGAGQATPAAYSCQDIGTPTAGMAGMASATPNAGMGHDMSGMAVEFDQMYIDMMIPHHGSIIALAEAALPRLTDERLREIAQTIITTQQAENEELRGYREQFYGSPDPMPMDDMMMGMMEQMMPSVSVPMDEMMAQMDAATQVAQFCAAADPDLAFIALTIPHHQSAIEASQDALTMAVHPEIQAFAQRVIDAQQAEIDELTAIRAELTGEATPAA